MKIGDEFIADIVLLKKIKEKIWKAIATNNINKDNTVEKNNVKKGKNKKIKKVKKLLI